MRRIMASVAMLLLLAGCDGEARTTVDVSGPGSASVQLDLRLSGEARTAVIDDPTLDQRLLEFVAEKSGSPARRKDSDGVLGYSATLSSDRMDGSLTGVSAIAVARTENGLRTVVRLTDPELLREAIQSATSGSSDSRAMSIAWQKSLVLSVVVNVPGKVLSVSGVDESLFSVSGGRVIVAAPSDVWPTGDLTILSVPNSPIKTYGPYATGSLLLGLIILYFRRR